MLAARLAAIDDLQLGEVETPSPGPGEILVKVGADTLCGTDHKIISGAKTNFVQLPVILGHESAGHVAEVGTGVEGYEVGDPVAMMPAIPDRRCWPCRHDLENACEHKRLMGYAVDGGLAEYMLVPVDGVDAGCLFKANADLPSEQLALAEPLGCVINGQRQSRVEPDDVVVVMGAGPIGLFHTQLARIAGAREIIVSQRSAPRRELALRLGATIGVNPEEQDLGEVVKETTGGLGADVVIVCIGVPELVNEALHLSRIGGRVNLFAGIKGKGWAEVEANLIHYNQIQVTGSSDARRSDYETALRLIESGRVDTESMISHRFPLSKLSDALATAAGKEAIKVAVTPS